MEYALKGSSVCVKDEEYLGLSLTSLLQKIIIPFPLRSSQKGTFLHFLWPNRYFQGGVVENTLVNNVHHNSYKDSKNCKITENSTFSSSLGSSSVHTLSTLMAESQEY